MLVYIVGIQAADSWSTSCLVLDTLKLTLFLEASVFILAPLYLLPDGVLQIT